MRNISIHIGLPDKALTPNGRVHWSVKSKAKRAQRETACFKFLCELAGRPKPMWEVAYTQPIFHVRDRRGLRRDRDNSIASLKGAFDALEDAGIIKNDNGLIPYPPVTIVDPDNLGVTINVFCDPIPLQTQEEVEAAFLRA